MRVSVEQKMCSLIFCSSNKASFTRLKNLGQKYAGPWTQQARTLMPSAEKGLVGIQKN
jgi:hypothetical protein